MVTTDRLRHSNMPAGSHSGTA